MHADLGKVLLHPDFGREPQWAVVGESSFNITHCKMKWNVPIIYISHAFSFLRTPG